MKTKGKILTVLALVLSLIMMLTACDGTPDVTEPAPEATIKLDKTSVTLDVGQTAQLTATVENTQEAPAWSSSDASVAAVDGQGLVTALKAGKATVTAKVGDAEASCEVTVVDSGTVPVMILSDTAVSVSKEATIDITATVRYKGQDVENVEYTWALAGGSSDTVASIEGKGSTATITGLEYGSTAFTVSATVNGVLVTETVYVTVCNTDITLEVEDLELGDDGQYTAKLSLADVGEHKSSLIPAIRVYDKNQPVEEPQIQWTVEDDTIVSCKDGVFTALKPGTTTITATVEGNSISIQVVAYKPLVELAGEMYVETLLGGAVGIPAQINGQVLGVTLNGREVLDSVSGSVALLKDLPTSKDDMGQGVLVYETEKITYQMAAFVCHRAIRTAEDLDQWGSWAKTLNEAYNLWDGYFVLANDIQYNKAYKPFISYAVLGDNAPGGFMYGRENGFKGIFDGRGHSIEGLEIGAYEAGGFIGVLHTEGVIRNVAFTEGVYYGPDGGYLCISANGTIENVYVQLNVQTDGSATPPHAVTGGLVAGECNAELRVNNCIVETNIPEGSQNAYGLGSFHLGYGILNNVYCIGSEKPIRVISNIGGGDIYGGFADLAAFQAAGIDFSEWDRDFWTILNGVPYPKCLADKISIDVSVTDPVVANGATVAILGASASDIITVDSASAAAGVKVEGTTVVIPENMAGGSQITVTVTSALDPSKKDTVVLTVKKVNLVSAGNFGDTETYGETVKVPLGSYAGTMTSLTLAGQELQGASYAEGQLTIPSAQLLKHGYELKTLTATFVTEEGDTTNVSFQLFVITKIIRTKADLNNWYNLAVATPGSDAGYYGGYFVLGNNIAYNDTYIPQTNWFTYDGIGLGTEWTNGSITGFYGVFDGRGYNIEGLRMEGDQAGGAFVTTLNHQGIIRNISFTKATYSANNTGFIMTAGNGELRNIYIECVEQGFTPSGLPMGLLAARDCMGGLRIYNCFVETKIVEGANATSSILGSYHLGYGILNGVYGVGNGPAINILSNSGEGGDVYGAYATREAMAAAGLDFSGFDSSFWKIDEDGLPYPKNLDRVIIPPENSVDAGFLGDVETYKANATVTIGNFAGSLTSLKSGEVELFGASYADGILTVPADQILANGYEIQNFTAVFTESNGATTSVSFSAFIVTKVIETKEDLNGWYALAVATPGSDAGYYGGYFVLGNDIAYNDAYVPQTNWFTYDGVGLGGDWTNGNVTGFYGVFDGRGYNIDGLRMEGDQAGGAFVTTLNHQGVIRNISFTNATYSANNTGFILTAGNGELRNIYIHCLEQGYHSSLPMGLLVARDCMGSMRLYNCFVETKIVEGATANSSILGTYHLCYGILNGVYGVGNGPAINVLSNAGGGDVYGGFATRKEMAAAGLDFSGFDSDFWTIDSEGLPYPKNLGQREHIPTHETVDAGWQGDLETYGEHTRLQIGQFAGVLTSLQAGGIEIPGAFYENGELYIPSAQLIELGYEDKSFTAVITTDMGDTTTVTFSGFVVTKVIRDKADLNNWTNLALATPGSDVAYYGGYFVLGNDIAYSDAYIPAINWNTLYQAGKDNLWMIYAQSGFHGVFDGRGYNIDGLRMEGDQAGGAFITQLHNSGVIRNVSFTNATYSATNTGFLVYCGNGQISNVYIHCVSQGYDPIGRNMGLLVANDCMAGLRVTGCFVETNIAEGANATSSILGTYHLGYGILNGVYGVGNGPAINVLSNAGGGDIFGGFASLEEMAAANLDFSSFQNDFWAMGTDGLPYPANLGDRTYVPTHETVDAGFLGDVETYGANATVHIGAYAGSLTSLNCGETEITGASYADGVLSIPSQQLIALGYEGKSFTAVITSSKGDTTTVSFSGFVVTQVIRNKADLNAWHSYAAATPGSYSSYYGGYFVLGNDIAYNDAYYPATNWHTMNADGYGDSWINGNLIGFYGVFDGRGYNIDGLRIEGDQAGGAFITTLNHQGIIRNVSFTNAFYSANNAGFLCTAGNGQISNVYIQCLEQGHDPVDRRMGLLVGLDCMGALRLNHCFVETNVVGGGVNDSVLGSYHLGYGILNGVYGVGNAHAINVLSDAGGGDTYGAYASREELKAAVDFAAWEDDFWTVVDGIPVPKNLAN